MITDQEYPVRPAFSLLTKLLDDFTAKVPQSSFKNPGSISFSDINMYIQKYQDPRQADTIMRVQQELDETKIILVGVVIEKMEELKPTEAQHKTMESVLQRGEKLDTLVERSESLSAHSKAFYKTAKKVCDITDFFSIFDSPLPSSKTVAVLSCSVYISYALFILESEVD